MFLLHWNVTRIKFPPSLKYGAIVPTYSPKRVENIESQMMAHINGSNQSSSILNFLQQSS